VRSTLGQVPFPGFSLPFERTEEQFNRKAGNVGLISIGREYSPSLLFRPYRLAPNRFCPEFSGCSPRNQTSSLVQPLPESASPFQLAKAWRRCPLLALFPAYGHRAFFPFWGRGEKTKTGMSQSQRREGKSIPVT